MIGFPFAPAFPLLPSLAQQQFPINLGDSFEVIFDPVSILDPDVDLDPPSRPG
jgi:hypothetical protein